MEPRDRLRLSTSDLAILTALCRPYFDDPSPFGVPATNKTILDELGENGIFLSADTLRNRLKSLYARFDIEDGLVANAKRARLVEVVRDSSVIPGWGPGDEPAPAPAQPPPPAVVLPIGTSPSPDPEARGIGERLTARSRIVLTRVLPALAAVTLLLAWGPWRSDPSGAATDLRRPVVATADRAPVHKGYGERASEVCDAVNAADRAHARDLVPLERRLRVATTTGAQRDSLLDATQREIARSVHALTLLDALDPPASLSSTQRSTSGAWHRNIARIRAYAARLDQVSSRRGLRAAIAGLARMRPLIERDVVRLTAGLLRLGEPGCRIAPAVPTKTITLPELDRAPSAAGSGRAPSRQRSRPSRAPDPPGGGAAETSERAVDGETATSPGGGADDGSTRPTDPPRQPASTGSNPSDATSPGGGGESARPDPGASPPPPGAPPPPPPPPPAAPAAPATPAASSGGSLSPGVNPPSAGTVPGTGPPPPPPR